MQYEIVDGDLLGQDVDVIVNAWNRNVIPWWLLLPQGVSGAIKRKAGTEPFRALREHGSMPLGSARLTSAGKLPYKAIIHVAGINLMWRASDYSIEQSVLNAIELAVDNGFTSIALPVIGAGSGGYDQAKALAVITRALDSVVQQPISITIVKFNGKS